MAMTGRERFLCALNHKIPDTVPIFECVYSRPFFKDVLGACPEVFDLGSVMKLAVKVGYDFAFLPIPGTAGFRPEGITSGDYTDEWGITYRVDKSTWPIDAAIKNPCTDGEDFENYEAPDPLDPKRYETLREAISIARANNKGTVGNVRGPFSGAWALFGMEDFFYLLYDEPDVAHKALHMIADWAVKSSRVMLDMGVDALLYSDDYGSSTQPMFSPAQFREFILPELNYIATEVKKMGGIPMLHSDGCIAPLIPDIGTSGMMGLHPIERCPGLSLADVKAKYGKDFTIFGNVDNKDVLVNGTPADIEEMVKECIRIAGPEGGYCLSSDHSVHDDMPNENIYALYEAGRKWGAYPLKF
ncbi:MAG: hypothetical protein MJ099_03450 [Clostridia bacterium]|nr:hypothetical protein [Clostridia bacterium]